MNLAPKVARLVEARKASGISTSALAKLVGASPSTLSSIENGHHLPSKVLFKSICDTLGVNPRWIEKGEKPLLIPKNDLRQMFAEFMQSNIAVVDSGGVVTFTPKTDKNNLPLNASSDKGIPDMKAPVTLKSLMARLRRFTQERGAKSELAAFIERESKKSAPLSSISRWLSDEVEPGGEVALLMLNWVEEKERQQK